MYKISRVQGAPGGGAYKIRFPEGLCPIPLDGLKCESLPPVAVGDPWLEIDEGDDFDAPSVADVLASVEKAKAARQKLQAASSKEAAIKAVRDDRKAALKVRSVREHLETRAKAKAKAQGEDPEKWERFVDKDALAHLKRLEARLTKAAEKKAQKATKKKAKAAKKAKKKAKKTSKKKG